MLMMRVLTCPTGVSGVQQHMPRMFRLIRTPACDAFSSACIISRSFSEFIFARISAGSPRRARAASILMSSNKRSFIIVGLVKMLRKRIKRVKPVTELKN